MGPDTGTLTGEGEEDGRTAMKVSLDNSELSVIPETDEDRETLRQFMSNVDKDFIAASMDGEDLDELVFQPWCDGDASHCPMCGRYNG